MMRSRRSEETVLVDADWYEDPLGRFDGRFFDGERWTERVSQDGALAIDPDFVVPSGVAADPDLPAESSETGPGEPIMAEAQGFESSTPAVQRVDVGRHLQASVMQESPVRTVAVLDPALARPSISGDAAASPRRSGRAPVVWALLALIAALVVAALVLLGSDDAPTDAVAEPVELDSEQTARVEDLQEGGSVDQADNESIDELQVDAPTGAVAPDESFDEAEAIDVGGLRIVNGQSLLADLQAWHRPFAMSRGIELDPAASCWFGQLGGAAVQVAHCGPVGGSVDSEFLYDSVPLLFEDTAGGQLAQPVVDAVTIDAVLANALVLVGRDGEVSPELLNEASRGDHSSDAGTNSKDLAEDE